MSTEATQPTTREDSNKISMTLPPCVIAAMKAEGEGLDMTAGEWAKHQLIAAYTQPGGVAIKLRPVGPPLPASDGGTPDLFAAK
jgi:hypothetical protein